MDRSKSKKRLVWNSTLGVLDKILVCLLGLVLRRVFIHYLGAEMSGLSGFFGNVIDFLNLTTAGFAAAVYPRMYQYNANNDYDNIRNLYRLAEKFYGAVCGIIFLLGVGCSFFLESMIYDNMYSTLYLQQLFLLQIIGQCVRLMTNPAITLLGTRERGYISTTINIVVNVSMYCLQILAIIYTRNYTVYLIITIIAYFVMLLLLTNSIYHCFPWIKGNYHTGSLRMRSMITDMKYTVVMQIANFIFCSTDTIIISTFIGLIAVNAYTNYMTIATAVIAMYSAVEGAIKVYFGNKLRSESSAQEKEEFLKITTFVFCLMGLFCGTMYGCLIGDFIQWWIGAEYVQIQMIHILFSWYLFISMLTCAPQEYLQNFGMFQKEMYANISSAVINLGMSLLLASQMGISGVLVGTLIGMSIRYIQRTVACYKDIKRKYNSFLGSSCLYMVVFMIMLAISMKACSYIMISGLAIRMIIKTALVLLLLTLGGGLLCIMTKEGRNLLCMGKVMLGNLFKR